MKKIIKLGFLLIAFVSISLTTQAQKFGYMNSTALLTEMPEVKQMNSKLEDLSKQLEKKYKQMTESYQREEQAAVEKAQAGSMSPKEEQEVRAKLEKKLQEIALYEQDIQQQLMTKQGELFKPIEDTINAAIKAVASENGYQFIFDSRADLGIMLYADEAMDITTLVKAKLNM